MIRSSRLTRCDLGCLDVTWVETDGTWEFTYSLLTENFRFKPKSQ